jgi:hypothetical protein
MTRLFTAFLLLICLANFAWAGFGSVQITESTAGINQQDTVYISSLTPPFISIEPSGNGQMVFARNVIIGSDLATAFTAIYAQAIDQSNQLQSPVLLVDSSMRNDVSFLPFSMTSAENGNALYLYLVQYYDNVTEDENWTIYYDAQSGWQQAIEIPDTLIDVQLFMDSIGNAYALGKSTTSSLSYLYQYQADNTWLLVSGDISESKFGMGANNRLYRIYRGSGGVDYLSFFDTVNSQWEDPITINLDSENNPIDNLIFTGVNAGGDIFTVHLSYDVLNSLVTVVIRKYEADDQSWSTTPKTLDYANGIYLLSPGFAQFELSTTANGSTSIIGIVANIIDSTLTQWNSIHYSEQNGWEASHLIEEVQDTDSFQFANTYLNGLINILGGRAGLYTDAGGKAAIFFCRNNCKDMYAKTFSANTGWSSELYLPGLGEGSENTCNNQNAEYRNLATNVIVHSNGNLIAVNEFTVGTALVDQKSYLATVTGDILSAVSNTTCPLDNLSQDPTDPPPPATDPGDTGGSDSGNGTNTNTGDNNGGGASGGGSMSLPLCLLVLLILKRRVYLRFKKVM